MGLDAQRDDDVLRQLRVAGVGEFIGRPDNFPLAAAEAHVRALLGKVVEDFRVQGGEILALQALQKELGGERRGVPGVVPSGKGEQEDGTLQRRHLRKRQNVHGRLLLTRRGETPRAGPV